MMVCMVDVVGFVGVVVGDGSVDLFFFKVVCFM